MEEQRKAALQYASKNKNQFLTALNEILVIPSVSTDPDRMADMAKAAGWVADQLRGLGMKGVKVFPTSKHPIIYGEWLENPGAPTVLIYGHYDVQPADPLDLWKSPPFEPTRRGDNLYARGASDMKGQVVATIKALDAIVKNGGLPVNVKWLLEGEEEIGSPSLAGFIEQNKELLASDFCLNPDSGMIGADAPSITYALRGLAYFELRVYSAEHDLHSGLFGGVARNPANALAALVAGMHDEKGRVTLPGFYDKVRDLSAEERAQLARLPIEEKDYLAQTGAKALFGESGYTTVERVGARPTLDVNGMLAGFTGEGSKTVIPAMAIAKISTRLVPDQDPQEVHKQMMAYLEAHAPRDIRWELIAMQGSKASISDLENIGVKALEKALETAWGKKPYLKREGGSIPVVIKIQEVLKIESVLTGFGLPDDNLHAPNEKLHLPTWYKGIDALIHFFMNLAE
jgi:acetylornithine deacetylase/succinyl-diaminopimelate desuccinylase-like protein